MGIQGWTFLAVGITFAVYIGIAIWSRVSSTKGFYVAGQGVPALANGMATAADWMSAASFISMAGLISFLGSDGSVYLMGWTGGYVLLALLLAPYLRKFGKYTVPDFVGERFYSNTARIVAAVAALFVSFTYVAGQMRGVGVVFSRFLGVGIELGVLIGMAIVVMYAVLGGMKGITYTQVAQYCILIFAYSLPVFAIAMVLTDIPIPQIAIGDVLPRLNEIQQEFGLGAYSEPFTQFSQLNVFCITIALMAGTAGLPHVIVRFYTVKSVRAARWSAAWALLFIAILYTMAPAVAMFAKYYIVDQLVGESISVVENIDWVRNWAATGLITLNDANGDGILQAKELLGNIDPDIIVLATPEIANLSPMVIGLVAAGGLAAALSTASGLLLVISSSIAHDIYGELIAPEASDKRKLRVGRGMIFLGVMVAGYFGIYPPGFVAEVVAFAFGLAAASFFPIIVLGIFSKNTNKEGAIAGMLSGLIFTLVLILLMRSEPVFGTDGPLLDSFFGINAQGIGTIGMVLNFVVTLVVSKFTLSPPDNIQDLVEEVRYPRKLTQKELDTARENRKKASEK
jgi:cation/acetate symporter